MTKKHFIAIARLLRNAREDAARNPERNVHDAADKLADDFADLLRGINANFDRNRFLKACGVADE